MSIEKLNKDMEKKASGGSIIGDFFKKSKVIDFSKEVEYECNWCHKKFKQLKCAVDFACPHCGYGGYKSNEMWQEWYEKHKDDKR